MATWAYTWPWMLRELGAGEVCARPVAGPGEPQHYSAVRLLFCLCLGLGVETEKDLPKTNH